jgi:PilZ domain
LASFLAVTNDARTTLGTAIRPILEDNAAMATDVVVTQPTARSAPDQSIDLGESRAHLRRLDFWEWFRWGSVLFIALLLTGGIFSLASPVFRRDWFAQAQLDISVWALFGLVLLFSAYTLYQQVVITRLRTNHANRIAMAATLEMLRPPEQPAEAGHSKLREWERFHLDRRITVEGMIAGKRKVIYGRTSDISEGGVGAVLPESLSPGGEVTLRLPLGPQSAEISLTATLRHSRGFYHGFEFCPFDEAKRAAIRTACEGGVPLRWFRH